MARFRHTFRCTVCGNRWQIISKSAAPKQPKCPNLDCRAIHRDIGFDPAGQAVAIGGATIVRAIDTTAEIVMRDHKLTDLKDSVREGDIMAPRLPGHLQSQADTFFNPAANPRLSDKRKNFLNGLGKRAIAGAFRNTALDVKSVLPDQKVGLRSARIEKLRQG